MNCEHTRLACLCCGQKVTMAELSSSTKVSYEAKPGEWLSSKQVIEYLGVSMCTLHRLIANGKIPHRRVGKLYKFRKSEIDATLLKPPCDKETHDDITKAIVDAVKGRQ